MLDHIPQISPNHGEIQEGFVGGEESPVVNEETVQTDIGGTSDEQAVLAEAPVVSDGAATVQEPEKRRLRRFIAAATLAGTLALSGCGIAQEGHADAAKQSGEPGISRIESPSHGSEPDSFRAPNIAPEQQKQYDNAKQVADFLSGNLAVLASSPRVHMQPDTAGRRLSNGNALGGASSTLRFSTWLAKDTKSGIDQLTIMSEITTDADKGSKSVVTDSIVVTYDLSPDNALLAAGQPDLATIKDLSEQPGVAISSAQIMRSTWPKPETMRITHTKDQQAQPTDTLSFDIVERQDNKPENDVQMKRDCLGAMDMVAKALNSDLVTK